MFRHWNYRIVRRSSVDKGVSSESFGIHEAFYDSHGKIWSFSEEPVSLVADTPNELRVELEHMSHAFKSPALDYDKLPEPGAMADEPEEELPNLDDLDDCEEARAETKKVEEE